MSTEIYNKSIDELSDMLTSKLISPTELTQIFLDRIDKHNQSINAFVTVTPEAALEQAKNAEKILASKQGHSKLTGIPIGHKDLFATKGIKTTSCSKMLNNYIPPYDATVVSNLQQTGTITLGKLNMDEFAMGSSNETSYFGKCFNPWNLAHVPGGSSGGSAAAVAMRLTPAATGTDTGGSIRLPASYCGITGLKPTYGRVSRWGMHAFASSLDQAGPMAKSALDCAILLEAMAGYDTLDSTCINTNVPEYSKLIQQPISEKLTIGLPKEFFSSELDSKVAQILEKAITELKQLNVEFKEISLPNNELCIPAYYIIAPAEASSNLSRYDGIRYGYRTEKYTSIDELMRNSRSEGFGEEVKRRIAIGTYVLSSGYYDKFYSKAKQTKFIIKNDFTTAFKDVDVILAPTSPTTAFKIGSMADPISMYLSDIYTIAANLAELPAISLPAGFINELPIGMQFIGNYLEEEKILKLAHHFQTITSHHLEQPKIKTGV